MSKAGDVKESQYKCAMCGGIFNFQHSEEWSDKKAKEELKRSFGDVDLKHCNIVCDDCYQKVRPDTHPKEFQEYKAEKN